MLNPDVMEVFDVFQFIYLGFTVQVTFGVDYVTWLIIYHMTSGQMFGWLTKSAKEEDLWLAMPLMCTVLQAAG